MRSGDDGEINVGRGGADGFDVAEDVGAGRDDGVEVDDEDLRFVFGKTLEESFGVCGEADEEGSGELLADLRQSVVIAGGKQQLQPVVGLLCTCIGKQGAPRRKRIRRALYESVQVVLDERQISELSIALRAA
jgi:hypothetical protein